MPSPEGKVPSRATVSQTPLVSIRTLAGSASGPGTVSEGVVVPGGSVVVGGEPGLVGGAPGDPGFAVVAVVVVVGAVAAGDPGVGVSGDSCCTKGSLLLKRPNEMS